ncbi:sigma-54-dependent Fis family transcriptional regulator [Steroidobacter sp.]|uniref:sigma-54-dependent Fis family transcriptional regulator n=1 Tax=Steroidobacter sp. TaxID=1978227 RepID=UPI001A419BAC|nr:sigma-54-dependent Fis family transcriptional regulator [Steroidobacter sp.]MBL8265398.1 sigma-54-dependent Fis family transcriptional regulator [Steroidobacter sp.]
MTDANSARHLDEVLRSVSGLAAATETSVAHGISTSWSRCARDYRLDPARTYSPTVLTANELRERRAQNEELIMIAGAEMNLLYDQISGSGYALLLTDARGVILRERVDPTLRDGFRRSGLLAGADWSEQVEGTNGIGTCIAEGRSVIVHRDEHFHCDHVQLSCSGAPIRDPSDEIIGVLDASCVGSHDTRVSQMHTMALVKMSAYAIEKCLFLRRHRHHAILRFHYRPELVNLNQDGALAVSEDGTIVAADRTAVTLLGLKGRHEVRGRPIEQLFDMKLQDVLSAASASQSLMWSARELTHGRRYVLSLHKPMQSRSTQFEVRNARSASPIVHIASMPRVSALSLDDLAGEDPQLLRQVRQSQRIVDSGIPVVIHGPTGSGKEVFARALHAASRRADQPFIAVNCAAIPETLIESELFGYRSGAFTGARKEGMKGKILQSSRGTLFLDEIGDMPLAMQTRLLRVLEERKVEPLGSELSLDVELHVVAASHRNLRDLIARNLFREDLFYRLNGMTIELPALADRDDCAHVIQRVLAAENRSNRPAAIETEALRVLVAYSWPGNVRELRNVIRTALALCEDGVIRLQDLPAEIHRSVAAGRTAAVSKPVTVDGDAKKSGSLEEAERDVVVRAIEDNRWNMTNAARQLGMSRNSLYRKIKLYQIPLARGPRARS